MSQPTPPSGDQPYEQQPYAQQQPPQYAQGGYGYGGYPPVPGRPTNTMAIVSLVAGICGLTVVPFLGSIAAVITGPMAKRQIAETGEEGTSFATWGLILGWIGIALGVLGVLFFLLVFGTMFASLGVAANS